MSLGELLYRREKEVEKRLSEYATHWWECIQYFRQAMDAYLEEGPSERLDYCFMRVDQEESKGDELRRKVDRELFERALLPESRGDILRVLEALDAVINRAESLVRHLVVERLVLEPWLERGMGHMVEATLEACGHLHKAAKHLLSGQDAPIADLTYEIEKCESRCDHLGQDLLGRVFSSDLELARKLQLKDFVRRFSGMSDLAEEASDSIYIISVKRRV